jgi:hypothetical protein
VDHHFEPDRLTRRAFLEAARKRGASRAYLEYHWVHASVPRSRPRMAMACAQLPLVWARGRAHPLDSEGCPEWEIRWWLEFHKLRHYLSERKRPRNYHRRGLIKKAGLGSAAAGRRSLKAVAS